MKRTPFFVILCFTAFYVAGVPRTAFVAFAWEAVLMQALLCGLVLGLPCVLLGRTAGGRISLWFATTLFGIMSSNLFATFNEMAIRRQFGEQPAAYVTTSRWVPFSNCAVSYEPGLKRWVGDD